jgi:MoaA/NifB/PqqE/SkfB family radical SAM enzyme
MKSFDFDDRPFIVIWEVTRACSLACRHCRAEANPSRHPLELTTNEAFRLIDQIECCRPTLFVMTGGDPIAGSI